MRRGALVAVATGLVVGLAACWRKRGRAAQLAGHNAATIEAAEPSPPETAAPETSPATSEAVTTKEPAETALALAPGLPEAIAGYEAWPRLNEDPIPPRAEGDAHLGTKDVYAADQPGSDGLYPNGSIIVKEAARPETDFVGLGRRRTRPTRRRGREPRDHGHRRTGER
jgi:hypothetical protein